MRRIGGAKAMREGILFALGAVAAVLQPTPAMALAVGDFTARDGGWTAAHVESFRKSLLFMMSIFLFVF